MAEIASLPLFHQIAGQSVLVLGDGPAAEPKRRLVERAGGIVVDDHARAVDEGVRIAFVAFEDAKACEVVAINLRCAGMIVNVVDRPDLCDFTTPSILDRDPLLIAVGTGGASAGLAKHVRLRLERILPQSLGKLADALKAVRPRLRSQLPGGAGRRRAIDAALREGGTLDPLDEASHQRVKDWADGLGKDAAQAGSAAGAASRGEQDEAPDGPADGAAGDALPPRPNNNDAPRIADCILTSADPEDLTLRQARMLGEADIVCTHGDVSGQILARARADAVRIQCDLSHCPAANGAGGVPACALAEDGAGKDLGPAEGPTDGPAGGAAGAAPSGADTDPHRSIVILRSPSLG